VPFDKPTSLAAKDKATLLEMFEAIYRYIEAIYRYIDGCKAKLILAAIKPP
jgi:hypothetical protein